MSHDQGGRLSGLEGESLFYFKENPAGLLFQGQEGAPVTQTQGEGSKMGVTAFLSGKVQP